MKKKIIIVALFLLVLAVITGGIIFALNKPSLYQRAYEQCMASVDGGTQEEFDQYCTCIIDSPKGILDNKSYDKFLEGYIAGSAEAKDNLSQYPDLELKMTRCLYEHGPLSTWVLLWMTWCQDQLQEQIPVCSCVLGEIVIASDSDADAVKYFIGERIGLYKVEDETEEEHQGRLNTIEQVFNYCRLHPTQEEDEEIPTQQND